MDKDAAAMIAIPLIAIFAMLILISWRLGRITQALEGLL